MQHSFPFLHQLVNARNTINSIVDEDYPKREQYFLSLFEIGLFEFYEFMFQHCKSEEDLKTWIINLKGTSFYHEKVDEFNRWLLKDNVNVNDNIASVLHEEQLNFWAQNGYLQLTNIIPPEDCDSVVAFICEELGINLLEQNSWYPISDKLHGLMLQTYQGAAIEKIRKNIDVFRISAQLYGTNQIIANTEKVSYNPPETSRFKFNGSPLHWDIDFDAEVRYHIQGLVYLNDVPADRGAFSLVSGYHKKIKNALKDTKPEEAIAQIKGEEEIIYLAGKKGDLILWLEAIPHAATANHSDLPRFVQYVSFSKF